MRHFDRDFLLSPAKRNQIMELWEIEKFGADSFGDPNYVSIYNMRPAEWYALGIRLLARTTLEAVRDRLGAAIGADVARLVTGVPKGVAFGVLDPFAGSCNSIYWLLLSLPNAKGRGFELDPTIFRLTLSNLALLDHPIELIQGNYRELLDRYKFPKDRYLVVFLAPPWADALDAVSGLDFARTRPPIAEIVADVERVYPSNPILYVVEAHEQLVPESLDALRRRFGRADLRVYDIAAPHGRRAVLFGTNRWPH